MPSPALTNLSTPSRPSSGASSPAAANNPHSILSPLSQASSALDSLAVSDTEETEHSMTSKSPLDGQGSGPAGTREAAKQSNSIDEHEDKHLLPLQQMQQPAKPAEYDEKGARRRDIYAAAASANKRTPTTPIPTSSGESSRRPSANGVRPTGLTPSTEITPSSSKKSSDSSAKKNEQPLKEGRQPVATKEASIPTLNHATPYGFMRPGLVSHMSVAGSMSPTYASTPMTSPQSTRVLSESPKLAGTPLSTSQTIEPDHKPKKIVAIPGLPAIEAAKRFAAFQAVDRHVLPHHRVIGIGSGSTVPYVIERIVDQGPEVNEKRWFVPTGFQSKQLICQAKLKLGDVDQFPSISVTIDGADDVDERLNAIKGGGACHLREKVLAEASDDFVIVADYRKNNKVLGDAWKQGVPIETPPFAWSKVLSNIERIPGALEPVLRMGKAKAGPVVTDNGNFIIDAPFENWVMREPEVLLQKLKMLTGCTEIGLFCGMASTVYFGNEDGSVTVKRSDGTTDTIHSEDS
ncbi:uncharacterized protein L969DRAFT_93970 [Mixia osmundae IAM 14324]|uniref:Ribose-5-phosphate isomerase n=1 Tax=Mixia osmundae (strain CBS 9802 / IAM 14324 / JCM 22182 / KY 12970) TaxID=764103 RepID=G7E8P3_MIXOS|nr:uncharacterized protein L969DRAFT_93970 [Mixia osmundae IAM 14324]KEI40147.1 hypothetical protein L969DRAFT_93970 [Mixia osmundae IAM 14324]GAA99511.1 hypothetical protein E5Q_06212 [Mixia osmundae IAM 14324]